MIRGKTNKMLRERAGGNFRQIELEIKRSFDVWLNRLLDLPECPRERAVRHMGFPPPDRKPDLPGWLAPANSDAILKRVRWLTVSGRTPAGA
jgi:hypothetical protein